MNPMRNRNGLRSVCQRLSRLAHPKYLCTVVLMRSGLCRLFQIQTPGDVRLHFFPSAIGGILWQDPSRFDEDAEFFRRYLRPGETFVDVGANVGYLSITGAKAVGPGGRVFAFEPHSRIAGYLHRNSKLNGLSNITIAVAAVGDRSGNASLVECPGDDSQNSVGSGHGFTVPMVRLDDVLGHLDPIALLKIDVEGYEKWVLDGADHVLERVQCVHLECCPKNAGRYGQSTAAILRRLEAKGFCLYRLDGIVALQVTSSYTPDRVFENVIGVRDVLDFFNRTRYKEAKAPLK